MSSDIEIPSPVENNNFIGHENAQNAMLSSFASGKLPNAWLITGPEGIGKATLAYRFAKFLLTNPLPSNQEGGLFGDDLSAEVPDSLDVDPEDPRISRIIVGSHGDLMVVDTDNLEDDKVRKEISIDAVRKVNEFLSLTATESDMRVVIVDCADQMNRNAANAILKILEEPPANSIILMVCHNIGRLLPTVKSRCRILKMQSLSDDKVQEVIRSAVPDIDEESCRIICGLADGSPGRALEIYGKGGINLYKSIVEVFSSLPERESEAVDSLSDRIEGKAHRDNWEIVSYLMQYFISTIVKTGVNDNFANEVFSGEAELKRVLLKQCSVAQWADLWEKVGKMSAEADFANLDKKHAFLTIYSTICNEVA